MLQTSSFRSQTSLAYGGLREHVFYVCALQFSHVFSFLQMTYVLCSLMTKDHSQKASK